MEHDQKFSSSSAVECDESQDCFRHLVEYLSKYKYVYKLIWFGVECSFGKIFVSIWFFSLAKEHKNRHITSDIGTIMNITTWQEIFQNGCI